jgi:hypothetical protein
LEQAKCWFVLLLENVDPGAASLRPTTMRSHDKFNTTIYSNDDRYCGSAPAGP